MVELPATPSISDELKFLREKIIHENLGYTVFVGKVDNYDKTLNDIIHEWL